MALGVSRVTCAWLVGSVPFTNYAALRWAGKDLRHVGTATVSGTALYRVAGFWALALVGPAELAKGALGAWLSPGTGGVAAVCGHNWSPLLRFEGGRGLSPMLGATALRTPEATVALAAGMTAGRLASNTGLGSFLGLLAAVTATLARRGPKAAGPVAAMATCVVIKRAAGNGRPRWPGREFLLHRILFDCDPGTRR